MNATDAVLGMLVKVGPAYVMADHPPFIGHGHFEPDAYTGMVFRVVAVRGPGIYCAYTSCALAPANLIGVDESDEVVDINVSRLEAA